MLPPEGHLMKERKKNSQFSVLQVLPCPTQHWLPPMRSKPDADIIGPLSSVSGEQGAPLSSSCWTLELPPPPFLVAPALSAHLEFVWYNQFPWRRWGKKSQLPLPFHFPFPQISGTSLFSCHVTALCHSSPCIQTRQTIYMPLWERHCLLWSIRWLSPSSQKGFAASSSLISKAGETFVSLLLTAI